MDYANERWVRLYTRDTTTWKLLTWEARSLLSLLLRKVDRSGQLDVGEEGIEGLAAQVEMPLEVVERVLPQLLKRGVVADVVVDGVRAFILPNFIAAQETPASDKHRASESRASRRARAVLSQNVTPPSRNVTGHDSGVVGDPLSRNVTEASRNVTGESRNVTEASHGVTRCHAASHAVTPTDPTDPTDPDLLSGKPDAPPLVLLPDLNQAGAPAKPDPGTELAAVCCATLNRLTGSAYDPATLETAKLARKLASRKVTPAEVRAVAEDRVAAWRDDEKMRRFLRPATLLAESKFMAYREDLRAGPKRGGGGGAIGTAPLAPRRMAEFRFTPHPLPSLDEEASS